MVRSRSAAGGRCRACTLGPDAALPTAAGVASSRTRLRIRAIKGCLLSAPPPGRARSRTPDYGPCRADERVHGRPRWGGVLPPAAGPLAHAPLPRLLLDRKSTRLNSSHVKISYAVFCLKKKTKMTPC